MKKRAQVWQNDIGIMPLALSWNFEIAIFSKWGWVLKLSFLQ